MFLNGIFNSTREESFHGNSNSLADTITDDGSYNSNNTLTNTTTDDGSRAAMQDIHDPTASLQDDSVGSTMYDNTTAEDDGTPPSLAANDNTMALLNQVNDSLENEMMETKKAVQRIFKELVAFHEAAKSVHELWAPIHEAELQESIRLDELQAEVQGTIGACNVPMMGSYTNQTNSYNEHTSSD